MKKNEVDYMYKIIQIDEKTYQIDEERVRFFLLIGEKKALLIDSGMMVSNALDIAKELTDLPIELINTHGDRDHIASNIQFEWAYMHPSEYTNYKGISIHPVWDGDVLDLGNRKLEIIHIPGHTPGSIAILDCSRRIVFSGDPVQKDGNIFMFGSQRNLEVGYMSLQKLNAYDFDTLYPSHATCPITKVELEQNIVGLENILNKKITGTKTEVFGNPVMEYDIGVCRIWSDIE